MGCWLIVIASAHLTFNQNPTKRKSTERTIIRGQSVFLFLFFLPKMTVPLARVYFTNSVLWYLGRNISPSRRPQARDRLRALMVRASSSPVGSPFPVRRRGTTQANPVFLRKRRWAAPGGGGCPPEGGGATTGTSSGAPQAPFPRSRRRRPPRGGSLPPGTALRAAGGQGNRETPVLARANPPINGQTAM